jgi:sigma-B regulation protein RsbQ
MTTHLNQHFNLNVIGNPEEERIIFVHGFASNQHVWQWLIPYLEKQYQLILFDLMGSGQSAIQCYSTSKYSTLDGYSDNLIELIEKNNWEPIYCVGHSVGGMIALLASIKRPDLFKKIVTIGASPRYMNDTGYNGGFTEEEGNEILDMLERNYPGWASLLAPIALPRVENSTLTDYIERNFISNNAERMYTFFKATFFSDYRSQLEEIVVPVTLIQSSEDSFVPIEVSNFLNSKIKQSTLYMIQAKGHYPHLSRPKETAEIILASLS